jgi:hypothetical protein
MLLPVSHFHVHCLVSGALCERVEASSQGSLNRDCHQKKRVFVMIALCDLSAMQSALPAWTCSVSVSFQRHRQAAGIVTPL